MSLYRALQRHFRAASCESECGKITEQQVQQWYPRLFRTALRLTGNHEDAADFTQQTFCKALVHWDRYDGRAKVATWLHTILVNCIRDAMRRKAVVKFDDFDKWSVDISDGKDRENDIEQDEKLKCLRDAIDCLSPELKKCFIATTIDGYTYAEAAEILGVPVGTIGHRVFRARKEVQNTVARQFQGI